jgi:hypothetical protein
MADYARMTGGSSTSRPDTDTPTSGVRVSRPTFAAAQPSADVLRAQRGSRILVLFLAGLFIVASLAFILSASSARPQSSATPEDASGAAAKVAVAAARVAPGALPPAGVAGVAVNEMEQSSAAPAPVASAAASPAAQPVADPTTAPPSSPALAPQPADPAASVEPAAIVSLRMPIVPVIGFWGTDTAISRGDLVSALTGESSRYRRVVVPAADRDAIAAALGIRIAESVESLDPAAIERAVRQRRVLGLLRASDVTYRVRSLGVGDAELFGNDRVRNVDAWPLVADVTGPEDTAWDQRATWTLVAGGDSFTDRGIYERVVNRGKGVDYPFDGGTARVTGHYCCGPFVTPGHPVPSYELSGPRGVVRALTKDADLAIANHESPIPDDWDFHLHGFIFSGKPELTEIFVRGGIDWFSLANNHIKDYGTDGVVDTRRNLDRFGIKYSGAGKDLAQARKFSVLPVNGVKVAIIPCTAIATYSMASRTSGGATPCRNRFVVPDIREAREQADIVIVFPHWGVEYDRDPLPSQRQLAADWVEAGADLVLGAHSHVAGAIEEIDGTPVFYSLGNFIFDQNWATYTMESYLLEATFRGDRIVQMRLHPFLSHDQAQPNLLDPARDDGRALLRAVRKASFIDW